MKDKWSSGVLICKMITGSNLVNISSPIIHVIFMYTSTWRGKIKWNMYTNYHKESVFQQIQTLHDKIYSPNKGFVR